MRCLEGKVAIITGAGGGQSGTFTGRNRAALRQLLGEGYRRVLTSDRHKVYDHLAQDRQQLCWSHLRQDFQAMVDRHHVGSSIGRELVELSRQMLGWWKRVRDMGCCGARKATVPRV
jgi:NAD(P)-dependent dehydrogenase (short-subunit alcohol dehydrogenase family)